MAREHAAECRRIAPVPPLFPSELLEPREALLNVGDVQDRSQSLSKHDSEYYRSMAESDDSSTRSWDSIPDDWLRHAATNEYRNSLPMPLMLELLSDVTDIPT